MGLLQEAYQSQGKIYNSSATTYSGGLLQQAQESVRLQQSQPSKQATVKITPSVSKPKVQQSQGLLAQAQNLVRNIGNSIKATFTAPKVSPPLPNSVFQQNPAINPQKPVQITPNQTKLGQSQLKQVAGAFPSTTATIQQIIKDPWNSQNLEELKKNPIKKIVTDFAKPIIDALGKQMKLEIQSRINPPKSISKQIGTQAEKLAAAGQTIFSPLSGLFNVLENIPNKGVREISRAITIVPAILGDAGKLIPDKIVDYLAEKRIISEQAKKNIKPGLGEIGSLAGQLLIGKIAEIGPLKRAELVKRFGEKDANLIVDKAQEIASEKGKNIQPIVSLGEKTPQQLIGEIIKNSKEKTTEGKELVKTALEAQDKGMNIILEKLEELATERSSTNIKRLELFRGSKGKVIKETKSFDKVLKVEGDQRTIMTQLAENGDKKAQNILNDKNFFVNADKYLQDKFNKTYDAIEYKNTNIPQKGIEYHDLGSGRFYSTTKEVASVYSKQNRGEKYETKTPSKIGLSIEQKAIEDKLTKGFEGVAGYDKIKIKEQAQLASETLKDIESARSMIRGETSLPKHLDGVALITAMEDIIKKAKEKNDSKLAEDLAHELANSPLISETSVAGQKLRLARERVKDSVAQKYADLRKAKEEALQRRIGSKSMEEVKKRVVDDIKKQVKKPDKYDWNRFIESIKC